MVVETLVALEYPNGRTRGDPLRRIGVAARAGVRPSWKTVARRRPAGETSAAGERLAAAALQGRRHRRGPDARDLSGRRISNSESARVEARRVLASNAAIASQRSSVRARSSRPCTSVSCTYGSSSNASSSPSGWLIVERSRSTVSSLRRADHRAEPATSSAGTTIGARPGLDRVRAEDVAEGRCDHDGGSRSPRAPTRHARATSRSRSCGRRAGSTRPDTRCSSNAGSFIQSKNRNSP